MARCDRRDCPGYGRAEIDEQGFCTECDRRPLAPPAPPAPPHPPGRRGPEDDQRQRPGPDEAGPRGAGEAVRPEPWWGLTLVRTGTVPPPPAEPEDPGGAVPEDRRLCAKGHPVGRGRDGRPGRLEGYCGACGARYDFTNPGDDRPRPVIPGRYEVKRTLGAGGFGSALLAYDPNLGVDVVLKDLSRSEAVAETAKRERDALAGLRHDNIVRIYGYEAEGPYLVLEYVQGATLMAQPKERLDVILGHGLQILQALDYLHARGLLHMDVKPQNVIRFGEEAAGELRDRVRLIDFGAVRKFDDTGPATNYTVAYAPPEGDKEHASPTAGFDLFCLGRTLEELCRYHLAHEEEPGVRSLRLLLDRATYIENPPHLLDRGRRFTSARQFAEQLSGVIHQVVTAPTANRLATRQSALFGPMTEPLHCGLGAPRPAGHWVTARLSAAGQLVMDEPFTRPQPADMVTALPAPLAVPDDGHLPPGSIGPLADCRAALRRGDLGAADAALSRAGLPVWSWARAWHAGLLAIARNDPAGASQEFSRARGALPGELVPLLALGLTAEVNDRLDEALWHYQAVAGTASAVSAAGFGLARVHLRQGNRAKAGAAATRLATELSEVESRFEREARVAVIRLHVAVLGGSVPGQADLAQADQQVDALEADAGTKIALSAEAEYGRSLATRRWLPLSERLRPLADQAGTRPEFFALVDLANQLRPPVTLWPQGFRPLRNRFRRIRDRSKVAS